MRYTESHEWIAPDGTVGISVHAQRELGEIVHIELPTVGTAVEAGSEVAVIESTKSAADVYAPISGTIEAVNDAVRDNPALINADPEGRGWLYRIAAPGAAALEALLSPDAYAAITE